MKLIVTSVILCVALYHFIPVHCQFGSKLRDCYKTEKKELYKCLIEFFAAIKPALVDENRLPSGQALSKIFVKKADLSNVDYYLEGTGIWHNFTFRGFENCTIDKATIDINDNRVNLDISIANLTGVGIYTLNASVMNNPVTEGHGNHTAYLLNVTATLTFTIKGDKDSAHLEDFDLDLNVGNFRAEIDGLVGGERTSKAFVDFVNEDKNVALINAVKQPVVDEIAISLFDVFKDYFKDFPVEIFTE